MQVLSRTSQQMMRCVTIHFHKHELLQVPSGYSQKGYDSMQFTSANVPKDSQHCEESLRFILQYWVSLEDEKSATNNKLLQNFFFYFNRSSKLEMKNTQMLTLTLSRRGGGEVNLPTLAKLHYICTKMTFFEPQIV